MVAIATNILIYFCRKKKEISSLFSTALSRAEEYECIFMPTIITKENNIFVILCVKMPIKCALNDFGGVSMCVPLPQLCG